MYEEGVQTYTAMFEGFHGAATRFLEAVENGWATQTYVALFEALNWAVVLDERTAKIWAPRGEILGWDWRGEIEGAEMLRGVRFARNSMHHDWSEVLELAASEHLQEGEPLPNQQWIWREVANLPRRGKDEPDAEAVYIEQLAGRLVRSTLVGLYFGFDLLRSFLEPSLLHNSGPERPT